VWLCDSTPAEIFAAYDPTVQDFTATLKPVSSTKKQVTALNRMLCFIYVIFLLDSWCERSRGIHQSLIPGWTQKIYSDIWPILSMNFTGCRKFPNFDAMFNLVTLVSKWSNHLSEINNLLSVNACFMSFIAFMRFITFLSENDPAKQHFSVYNSHLF